jgi:Flp pilus assembly pilin Flp
MRELLGRFGNDEGGAADIEYCLIAALAGLAVFGAVKLVGPYLKSVFASATPSTANPTVEIILYRKGD